MPSPPRRAYSRRSPKPAPPTPDRDVLEQTLRDWLGDPTLPTPPRAATGRPPVVTALLLWSGLLVCLLRGFTSQLDLWRLLTQWGLWDFPKVAVTDMALYNRLERTPPTAMTAFFHHVSQALRTRLGARSAVPYASFATEIFALDQSVLDPLLRKLKLLRDLPKGDHALLPGVLGCLFDVRRQQWAKVEFSTDALRNEKPSAPGMVRDLPKGSLLLFDLGYFAFCWFDLLAQQGLHYVSRLRQKTSFKLLHVLYEGGNAQATLRDCLVYLGAHDQDKAAYPVRLIEVTVRGPKGPPNQTWRYLTNVLDPRQLPAWQVVALYKYRWDIESAFKLLKTELGLHLLWSGHENTLLHQVYATLLLSQIILGLRFEIAEAARADVREVSLALMLRWLPRLAGMGLDPVAEFVVGGRRLGFLRPFRTKEYLVPRIPEEAYRIPPEWPPPRKARYGSAKRHREQRQLQEALNAQLAREGVLV